MYKKLTAFAALLSVSVPLWANPLDEYWSNLESLCGQAFEGELITHPEGEDGFVRHRLVMHVRDCQEDRIRIPFVVGDDLSRTWVLTRKDDRLELKHDHRHDDGTPEETTMYGGTTTNLGRANEQYFPAGEQTRGVIEAAFSNVWVMRVFPGEKFTYGLWRLGTPRVFQVDFDLTQPVEAPPAPWGWED
ncbi:MAG: hypothetical protein LAT56_09895 [Wenzhouxiangella sp.]|nr:hypothetical protein [Wenzhouxiangella sp.]